MLDTSYFREDFLWLLEWKKTNIGYFHAFGCKYYILNNRKEQLGKFDLRLDESIYLGYSTTSKANRIYNKRILMIEESIHVMFDETNDLSLSRPLDDDDDDLMVNKDL